jgi:hypothetical protein
MSENARQVQLLVARMSQLTGRRYPKLEVELSRLTVEALHDLTRFVGDAQVEVQRVKNQAIHQPWRR